MKFAFLLFSSVFLFGLAFAETDKQAAPKPDPFAIVFHKTKVSFSGTIHSKQIADELANVIVNARPELKVYNAGLAFDSKVKFPDRELFENLLVEVALSTHQGVIELSDERLVVGGLTDSVVASSVLRLRAKPILGDRILLEKICLIPSSDVPDAPALLSTGETRQVFSFDLEMIKRQEVAYEPPGFLLTKIPGLIEATKDISIYLPEDQTPELTQVEKPKESADVKEEPVSTEPGDTLMAEATAAVLKQAVKPDPYVRFGPILFGRNGFFLQSGQDQAVEGIAAQLNSPPWDDKVILMQSVVYQSSSAAFAEWLGDRRRAEALKLLVAAGIDKNRIKAESVTSLERIDGGEVRILVKKPEGYDDEEVADGDVVEKEDEM